MDIAREDAPRQGLKLDDIISMVVPRQSYLKRIDPDGTREFADIKAEVTGTKMAHRYFSLVQAEETSARHSAEIERGLISTLDIYESFNMIQRQPAWAGRL